MSNGKTKIYKNPGRNQPAPVFKPYVPQYVMHDIEPEEFKSAVVPTGYPVAKPSVDNPRLPRPPIRQAYAATVPSPVGRGKGPIPNVGNNIEHTWSGVDGDIVDDLSGQEIDPNQSMVDNNEYISNEALGLPPSSEDMPQLDEVVTPQPKKFMTNQELTKLKTDYDGSMTINTSSKVTVEAGEVFFEGTANPPALGDIEVDSVDSLLAVVNDLEEDSYLLIVNDVPVCSGPLEEIQNQATAMVFGEHELCEGQPVDVEDIVVLKRVCLKVGLFLQ